MSEDTVKVRFALAQGTPEGVLMTLTTTAGPKVKFLLDDVALATLQLSLSDALEGRLDEVRDDMHKHIVFTPQDKA